MTARDEWRYARREQFEANRLARGLVYKTTFYIHPTDKAAESGADCHYYTELSKASLTKEEIAEVIRFRDGVPSRSYVESVEGP